MTISWPLFLSTPSLPECIILYNQRACWETMRASHLVYPCFPVFTMSCVAFSENLIVLPGVRGCLGVGRWPFSKHGNFFFSQKAPKVFNCKNWIFTGFACKDKYQKSLRISWKQQFFIGGGHSVVLLRHSSVCARLSCVLRVHYSYHLKCFSECLLLFGSVLWHNITFHPPDAGLTRSARCCSLLFFVVLRIKHPHAEDVLSKPTAKLLLYLQLTHADYLKLPCGGFTVQCKLRNGMDRRCGSAPSVGYPMNKLRHYRAQNRYWIGSVPSLFAFISFLLSTKYLYLLHLLTYTYYT